MALVLCLLLAQFNVSFAREPDVGMESRTDGQSAVDIYNASRAAAARGQERDRARRNAEASDAFIGEAFAAVRAAYGLDLSNAEGKIVPSRDQWGEAHRAVFITTRSHTCRYLPAHETEFYGNRGRGGLAVATSLTCYARAR